VPISRWFLPALLTKPNEEKQHATQRKFDPDYRRRLIGRALAESFHALGNKVISAGRRQSVLDETTAANPGMASLTFDIENRDGIRAFAAAVTAKHPNLNVLINNAGIMRPEDLQAPGDLADAEATIVTNLLGPIRPRRCCRSSRNTYERRS